LGIGHRSIVPLLAKAKADAIGLHEDVQWRLHTCSIVLVSLSLKRLQGLLERWGAGLGCKLVVMKQSMPLPFP